MDDVYLLEFTEVGTPGIVLDAAYTSEYFARTTINSYFAKFHNARRRNTSQEGRDVRIVYYDDFRNVVGEAYIYRIALRNSARI